ncbi:quinone-dependent dihydroorotate dehydrogenase [Chloroflexus sp.]|uniref:quinone-dependent dihydroorotate dehydrogenase n=1 Tax=Chloroflexus sp. TaxID=1904827 RepID=UPI002639C028|nr:quinone-dependent dihydroorotate dehydrogenase [uncultured Chloroflexus sp.]
MNRSEPMMYRFLLRPILFRLGGGDAETAHERTLHLLALLCRSRQLCRAMGHLIAIQDPGLTRTVFGIKFPNPVGLAAGMDKDGVALPAWETLGFGFVEVGTVTRYPQPGNPRPRLFRLPAHEALINRMGFNNAGAAALSHRLAATPVTIPVGVSIGKSKITPLEQAVDDYRESFRSVFPYAAYVAINVSSPNTPGLRQLQDAAHLRALLAALQEENATLGQTDPRGSRPLLVKVAPDLSESALDELLMVCADHAVAGIIATNTTVGRNGLEGSDSSLIAETGGLSGLPLSGRSRQVVRFIARATGGRLPIIGVGGIHSPDDALRMFEAGATLIQLYTGLVYRGPFLPRRINRALLSWQRERS